MGIEQDVPTMGPIVHTERLADRELLISVSGELDLHSVGELQDALDEAISESCELVVVDLGEVDLIDSIALGALARASRRLRETNGALGVVASNADVVRAFQITSLDRVIPMSSTKAEVLQNLRASGV
ncbi:MAG TPA: STAS domain-containing protein [Gaiellaceae bacterium]|jgi:anti-sigma B factor antagonist